MSRFTRFFTGKFQYFGKCAGVKHLTNIMPVILIENIPNSFDLHTCTLHPLVQFTKHYQLKILPALHIKLTVFNLYQVCI